MQTRAKWKALILVGALLAPCLAFSAESGANGPGRTDEGVAYMSGGVGEDEREAMHELARNYNLRLVFAEKDGAYLSDVKVDIRNAAGRDILSAVSNGPWFFAKLPNGRYKIKAEVRGKSMAQSAVIGRESQAELKFYWAE